MVKTERNVNGTFKKGHLAISKGRPKHPFNIPEKYTRHEILAIITKYLRATTDGLRETINDKKAESLDKWICAIILKGSEEGDYSRLTLILDRLIGKVKEKVEHEVSRSLHVVLLEQIELIQERNKKKVKKLK